jgi:streptogramin lyase
MGVNKINKYVNDFKLYQQAPEGKNGLNSNFIWSFDQDKQGNLWIGTSDGVNILHSGTNTFSQLVHDPSNSNSLADNEVRTLIFTPKQNCFWFGLYGTGLDKYDPETNEFRHFVPQTEKNSLSDSYVNDIIYDSDGYLWIATGRGLNRFQPDSGIFKVYFHDPDDAGSLSHNIVISLFEDSHGCLWIGTTRGLNKFDKNEQRFTRYFYSSQNDLESNTIFSINEDRSGVIWIGTSGGGLVSLNHKTGDYHVYNTRDGLPNNIIYGILEDEESNLWLSSNLGLIKFNTWEKRYVNYDVKDGIQSYEFNLGSFFKDHKGNLYFGGMSGFNVFNPAEIITNPNIPVIVVSSFRKFNEIQPFELKDGDTVLLNYDDNFFSFEISALDYTNTAKNKYRYFLENIDKDWVMADMNIRSAEYKKVQPGIYTFHASGSNNDGVWNEQGISVTIIIRPPWYATLVFRITVILIVIFTLWILIYRRIRRIRRKHEVEKKLLEIEKQKFDLEQKALRLQMNPHFIFNSLNSIQSYIISHDTEKAVTYLGKFSQLMRLILTNSGSELISLMEELKSITYYLELEKLRFDNKFDYEIQVDEKLDQEFVEIPPMIVQPYIENAIIHGLLNKPSRGKLIINFRMSGNKILCAIQDNGIGREESSRISQESGINRKSRGMLVTKARLEILNRMNNEEYSVKVVDLKDESGKPSGTRVELIIHHNEE